MHDNYQRANLPWQVDTGLNLLVGGSTPECFANGIKM